MLAGDAELGTRRLGMLPGRGLKLDLDICAARRNRGASRAEQSFRRALSLAAGQGEDAMKTEKTTGLEAYLGRNVNLTQSTSSLPQSSSKWLNNGKIRELLPIWLLRRNGPDFPVEA